MKVTKSYKEHHIYVVNTYSKLMENELKKKMLGNSKDSHWRMDRDLDNAIYLQLFIRKNIF